MASSKASPCASVSRTAWMSSCGSAEVVFMHAELLQGAADERDLTAMNVNRRQRADKHDQSEREEQAAVALHNNSQLRQMTADGAEHDARRQRRAGPSRAWHEDQKCGEQLRDPARVAAPRLRSDLGEDVNGLRSAGEFEVKR